MADTNDNLQSLTTGARRIVEAALGLQQELKHQALGVNVWLLVMAERHGEMLESMAKNFELGKVTPGIKAEADSGKAGAALDKDILIGKAIERATQRGKMQATERDLAAVILSAAGFMLQDGTPPLETEHKDAPSGAADGEHPVEYHQAATQPTPTLEQFGRDLTALAKAGKLLPTIGREEVVQLMIETLCRRTKRNPVLVGPAGVGKTAVVEGLAQRIIEGKVPGPLKNNRLIAIQPSTMVAGASYSGELEKRMKAVIAEASQEGILLFIDEFHSAIGAGGVAGTTDMASILKPALARGELACIAATTDDEYRRFIEPDGALERRFQPIRLQPPTAEQTVEILRCVRDELTRQRSVTVPDGILKWLVEFGEEFMRNRHFPDKAVDLLEQCFAYAVTQGKSQVEMSDAKAVAQRMVGMPLAVSDRLDALERTLKEQALFGDEDLATLMNRLQVTMRGLDMRTSRSNAVILLAGEVAQSVDAISAAVSSTLFGSDDRVVIIDLARMWQAYDINQLIGSPPGYVGYADSLPIHRVSQIPWCVLRFDNIDQCHPAVREVVMRALAEGSLRDARGKVVYLSDTIVILTAEIQMHESRHLGFSQTETHEAVNLYELAAEKLGVELVDQVDLIAYSVTETPVARRRWIERYLLQDLSERYLKQGLSLTWDASVVEWMSSQELRLTAREWERFVDDYLTPEIIKYLPDAGESQAVDLVVKYSDGVLAIKSGSNVEGG